MIRLEGATDEWSGRPGALRLAIRLLGVAAFGWALGTQQAFTGPTWIAGLSAFSLALMVVTASLRVLRPFDRSALIVITAMMLGGALINAQVGFLGTVFFVAGGVLLIGQPRLALRPAVAIVVVIALIMVGLAAYEGAGGSTLLSLVSGTIAVGLFGAYRRQSRTRAAQDRALAAWSRELELRNAELIAQTEATRREAARAAALEERSRIARDLHDVLAHSLGGLIVQLEAAGAELSRGDGAAAAARLTTSRQLAVDGLHGARAAVNELRTGSELDDEATPVDVVDPVTAALLGPVGISLGAGLEVIGPPQPARPAVAAALAAVAREALTNINKHAPGNPVSASLIFTADRVRLEVVNGLLAAIDASAAVTELAHTGGAAGLTGLSERVEHVGGRFHAGPEGRRWVVSAECPI